MLLATFSSTPPQPKPTPQPQPCYQPMPQPQPCYQPMPQPQLPAHASAQLPAHASAQLPAHASVTILDKPLVSPLLGNPSGLQVPPPRKRHSRPPEVWLWSSSSVPLVGGPVDTCQWPSVGVPDGTYSCSSEAWLSPVPAPWSEARPSPVPAPRSEARPRSFAASDSPSAPRPPVTSSAPRSQLPLIFCQLLLLLCRQHPECLHPRLHHRPPESLCLHRQLPRVLVLATSLKRVLAFVYMAGLLHFHRWPTKGLSLRPRRQPPEGLSPRLQPPSFMWTLDLLLNPLHPPGFILTLASLCCPFVAFSFVLLKRAFSLPISLPPVSICIWVHLLTPFSFSPLNLSVTDVYLQFLRLVTQMNLSSAAEVTLGARSHRNALLCKRRCFASFFTWTATPHTF